MQSAPAPVSEGEPVDARRRHFVTAIDQPVPFAPSTGPGGLASHRGPSRLEVLWASFLALGNLGRSAALLSLAVRKDPVAPTHSEVVATREEGTYESNVVSERRPMHRVSRPLRTTRTECGTDVPIRQGLSMRNEDSSHDRHVGQTYPTRLYPGRVPMAEADPGHTPIASHHHWLPSRRQAATSHGTLHGTRASCRTAKAPTPPLTACHHWPRVQLTASVLSY